MAGNRSADSSRGEAHFARRERGPGRSLGQYWPENLTDLL
jgi:hypothetical protein